MSKEKKVKLNKFEKARILSARGLELTKGAKVKVELEEDKVYLEKDYVKLAEKELEEDSFDLEIYKE